MDVPIRRHWRLAPGQGDRPGYARTNVTRRQLLILPDSWPEGVSAAGKAYALKAPVMFSARDKGNDKRRWTPEKGLELGAVGCLLAGALGILKAVHMEQASDALLCLLGSFGTCGFVCYLYFGPGSAS